MREILREGLRLGISLDRISVQMIFEAVEDSLLHLVGGFFRESQGENLFGRDILCLDKIGVTACKDSCLSAARTCTDDDISGLLYGAKLLAVQARGKFREGIVVNLKCILFVFYHFCSPATAKYRLQIA